MSCGDFYLCPLNGKCPFLGQDRFRSIENTPATLCPVCGGAGEYSDPPNPNVTSVRFLRTCHGCGGKGWVK